MIERSLSEDELADVIDEKIHGRGGSGGGGKKKKAESWGSKGRRIHKGSEARLGQVDNAMDRRENDEKSPADEVDSILRYLSEQDGENPSVPGLTKYLDWLMQYINNPDSMRITNDECGKWEQFTASVHAGGSGRQTSRNARARIHLITGIGASAEESRKAMPNQELVMEKLRVKLVTHVSNWRKLMRLNAGEIVNKADLDSAVLNRLVEADFS